MMACRCVECRRPFPIGKGKNGMCPSCQKEGLIQSLLFKAGNNKIITGEQLHRKPDKIEHDQNKQ